MINTPKSFIVGDKIITSDCEYVITEISEDCVSIVSSQPFASPIDIDITYFLKWIERPEVNLYAAESFKPNVHSNHEVIDNMILGKTFKYCRDCKEEIV